MAVELGTGYISLVVETSKLPGQIKSALDGTQAQADRAGQGMGSKLAAGLGKTLKVGAAGAGVAVGGILATSIGKGIGRLTAIENAEAKLAGLGHSTATVGQIMDNALTSVKGTAFGLGDAASIAASAVAAGVKPGKDLERTLSLTGDAATIAGVSIGEMGQVFGKVATSNKVQGDVINQLNANGIPIVQLLAKELGKTSEEIVGMSRKGTISFADFQNAMEQGLGGAALKSGETVRGAFDNMGAALGRFGAELAKPIFGRAAGGFTSMTAAIDKGTEAIKPFAAAFNSWLDSDAIPKMVKFGEAAKDTFKAFRGSDFVQESMQRLGGVFSSIVGTAREIGPSLATIARSLAEAAAATGVSTWKIFLTTLEGVAEIYYSMLVPALRTVADLMRDNQVVVNALAIGFLAFKTVPSILEKTTSALAPIRNAASAAKEGVASFAEALKDSWHWAGQANPEMGKFERTATIAGGNVSAAFRSIKDGIGGVVQAMGGLTGISVAGVTALLVANASSASSARSAQDALTQSVADGARAQETMFNALAATNGALDDQSMAAGSEVVKATMAEIVTLGQRGHSTSENLGRIIDNLTGNVFGLNDAWEEQYDHVSAMDGQYKELQSVMKSMKIDINDVYRITAAGGPEFEQLISNLEATGGNGKEVATQLRAAREQISGLQDSARELGPTAAAVAAGFKVIGDEASTADQKSSALKRTLDALAGGAISLFEAEAEVAEAHQKVAEGAAEAKDAADGFGNSLLDVDGRLKGSTPNGKAFGDAILEARDSLADFVGAGGDLGEKLPEIMDGLYQWGDSLGLSREKVDAVAAAMGLVPDTLSIMAQVSGKGQTLADIGELVTGFDALSDGEPRTVQVRALTEDAKAALDGLDFTVETLPSGLIEVTANTPEAEARLQTVLEMAAAIPADKTLDVSAPGADGVIDALNTIGVKVHTDNDKNIVIEDNSPETIAKLKALNITTTTLDDGTVVITDNVEDVKRNVNGLNSLRTSSTHTVTMEQAFGNMPPSVISAFGNTRRATGGPVFGAGTATSDSIPALLSNGEHVLTAAEVDAAGGHGAIYRMRDAIKSGVARFATGGAVGTALAAARSKEGNLYSWGGVGPDRFDCSGFVGFIQQIVMGISEAAAAGKRLYTTNSLLGGSTAGLVRGYNADSPFNVGVSNDHMAATVGGVNVESGGASSPSSSGVGPGRAGALDSQFGTQFHLPVGLVEGGYEQGAVYAATGPVWSEKDELDLKSARVAITQAQEAAAAARSNPKKSSADIEQAELKVARAEQKVADLEGKKEGRTGVQALTAPAAPPLMGGMDEDAIGLRQAELAVTDAQLSRDKTYADPASLSSDREKSDLAVYSAQNRLVETQKKLAEPNNALAATGGVKGAAQRFASDAAGIGYDAFWDIIGFQEPRWFKMDAPTVPGKPDEVWTLDHAMRDVPAFFSDAEIANQNPSSDMDEWLKRNKVPLHDEGGWLEPGLTLNMTKRPEPVLNPEQFANLKRIANLDQAPSEQGRTVEVHHHYHLTDIKDVERIKRQEQQRTVLQWS